MSGYLLIIIVMLIIIIILLAKIYLMKKSVKRIILQLAEKLSLDTNTTITTNTTDKDINYLANKLNVELKTIRQLELEYKQGNIKLKESINNITHDLRTPLTAISGYIGLLKTSNNIKKNLKYLNIIDNKTKELVSLTTQLHDYSRSFVLEYDIKKEEININELLKEVVLNYYILFKDKNIEPKIDICETIIVKKLNREMIIRIFENIILNAVKYSDHDFNVILNNAGKITFSNKTHLLDGNSVNKIFNRYYTLGNLDKSSGLGLSIAKELIELNNGVVNVKYVDKTLIIEIDFL